MMMASAVAPPSPHAPQRAPASKNFLDHDELLSGDNDDDDHDTVDNNCEPIKVDDEIEQLKKDAAELDQRMAKKKKKKKEKRRSSSFASQHHHVHQTRSLSPPRSSLSSREFDLNDAKLAGGHLNQSAPPAQTFSPTAAARSRREPSEDIHQRPGLGQKSHSARTMKDVASQWMGMFGWDTTSTDNSDLLQEDSFDDYRVRQSEVNRMVDDSYEFQRLKAALKAKGAVTNEVLKQRLHVYVHKNRERWHQLDSNGGRGRRRDKNRHPEEEVNDKNQNLTGQHGD